MNKTLLVSGVVGLVVVVGIVSFTMHSSNAAVANTALAGVGGSQSTAATPSTAAISSTTVPLMQSTGALFAQYKYANKANEIYPTLATGTQKALGAFSYSKMDLGDGAYRFTLTNSAEGYKGQSVVVGAGQTLYFIEPSLGDDSASEDSITTDDFFVVVDAQGTILK